MMEQMKCLLCGSSETELIAEISKKPVAEIDFGIPAASYHRTVCRCSNCGVYNNFRAELLDNLYRGAYNQCTYKADLLAPFNRIMALPEERSDNKNRVTRIIDFVAKRSMGNAAFKVLDVGSGLCVFLAELKRRTVFQTYCIDPDPLAVQHAIAHANVTEGFTGTFETIQLTDHYQMITLNKVLEHMEQPVECLIKAKALLSADGFIYIEVPDADAALQYGSVIDQEEFYIDHRTVFSQSSVHYLADHAGLQIEQVESIKEPSGKYTLYAFLRAR